MSGSQQPTFCLNHNLPRKKTTYEIRPTSLREFERAPSAVPLAFRVQLISSSAHRTARKKIWTLRSAIIAGLRSVLCTVSHRNAHSVHTIRFRSQVLGQLCAPKTSVGRAKRLVTNPRAVKCRRSQNSSHSTIFRRAAPGGTGRRAKPSTGRVRKELDFTQRRRREKRKIRRLQTASSHVEALNSRGCDFRWIYGSLMTHSAKEKLRVLKQAR